MNKAIAWNAFGNIIYLGCQWLMTVLVTRLMGYEDAGVFSLAMSISALFQTVALFGIRAYQVSDVRRKYQDAVYIGFRRITCLVAMVLCVVFSLLNFYNKTQLTAIFLFMCFRLAEDYSDVLHGIAQKNNRLDIAGKGFAVKGIVSFGMFFCGCYFCNDLGAGILLMAIGSWGTTILYDFLATRKLLGSGMMPSRKEYVGLGKETFPLCIYMFLMTAISVIPKYILEKMCGGEIFGAYSSIYAPALLIQAAAGYIYNPFTPSFAELYAREDYKGFGRLGWKIFKAILCVAIIVLAFVKFLGNFVLSLVFGEGILEYAYLLMPICISVFALSFLSFACVLSVVARDFKGLLGGCAVGVILCALCVPLAVDLYGVNGTSIGLAVGTMAANICLLVSLYCSIKKKIVKN